jgi:outer membrane lipoprotein LolB
MRRWSRQVFAALALVAVLAGGCAQRVVDPTAVGDVPVSGPAWIESADDPVAETRRLYAERLLLLDSLTGWHVNGRLGLTHADEQVALTINLRQFDAERWRLNLHGPIAGGSVRLDGERGQVVMRTADGRQQTAADGRTLLLSETGHDLPAEALAAWLQGRHWAPAGAPQHVTLDALGRPERLEQLGWEVSYGLYREVHAIGVAVPHRVDARRGELGVRVVVAEWRALELARP